MVNFTYKFDKQLMLDIMKELDEFTDSDEYSEQNVSIGENFSELLYKIYIEEKYR